MFLIGSYEQHLQFLCFGSFIIISIDFTLHFVSIVEVCLITRLCSLFILCICLLSSLAHLLVSLSSLSPAPVHHSPTHPNSTLFAQFLFCNFIIDLLFILSLQLLISAH